MQRWKRREARARPEVSGLNSTDLIFDLTSRTSLVPDAARRLLSGAPQSRDPHSHQAGQWAPAQQRTTLVLRCVRGTRAHSRGVMRPSFCKHLLPPSKEGAGKAGCPLHPQPGVRKMRAHQQSHHRFNRISPAFPARMVLTVSFVISSVSRALLPPSPTENRKLDISVGMSGPHDFAVRISTVRLAAPRVHRIPRSTSVTMRNAPPIEAGCAGITTDLG